MSFLERYILFFILIGLCAAFSAWASRKVKTSYSAFAKVANASHMTGYDTAVRLLRANDVTDISVGRVSGTLTDHYHPTKKLVNLSESVYGSPSVAAVAVAAHEIGHVMQKKKGYLPYHIRSILVTVANFGSRLAFPLVLLGVILDAYLVGTSNADLGYYFAIAGVVLYGASTLFMLVTLPVEFDASRRAKKMLVEEGILTDEEIFGASKVLNAAAMTYVASLAVSLVYFLRFLVWVLSIFGRRSRR
jgi:Zn-dependent membrane protease YugP